MVGGLGAGRARRLAPPAVTTGRPALRLHINAVGAVMGGAERHLLPFLIALHQARPGWSIFTWVTDGHEPRETPQSVNIRAVPRMRAAKRMWWESVELPRLLARDNADVLLNLTNSGPLRSPIPSILYQRNALWFDPAWVLQLRGRDRVNAAARRQLAYLQMRGSALTVVPSAAMAGFLIGWRGAQGAPTIRVIPHAVDMNRFHTAARSWPPSPGKPIRLVSVGHAARHKDQILLVRLVALLRGQGLDVVLSLTIEHTDAPNYVEEIQRECRILGVAGSVELLGRVADVERLYREADIMVFASRCESFGFPIVEAMASGIPVVASRIPASVELLGADGWFFPAGDEVAAAEAVRQLLTTTAPELEIITDRAAGVAQAHKWSENGSQLARAIEETAKPVLSG